jgi:precorrin-6B methylase 2
MAHSAKPRNRGQARRHSLNIPNRERTLQIEWVMDALKIGPGSVVADIGAGGGWFTVRAARRVGPRGVVYAQEILPKYIDYIAQRAQKEGLTNVRTILGTTNRSEAAAQQRRCGVDSQRLP